MKQSFLTFKTVFGDGMAYYAGVVRRMVHDCAVLWDEYAHLAVRFVLVHTAQTAILRLLRGYYAHFQANDCFECLLPHTRPLGMLHA